MNSIYEYKEIIKSNSREEIDDQFKNSPINSTHKLKINTSQAYETKSEDQIRVQVEPKQNTSIRELISKNENDPPISPTFESTNFHVSNSSKFGQSRIGAQNPQHIPFHSNVLPKLNSIKESSEFEIKSPESNDIFNKIEPLEEIVIPSEEKEIFNSKIELFDKNPELKLLNNHSKYEINSELQSILISGLKNNISIDQPVNSYRKVDIHETNSFNSENLKHINFQLDIDKIKTKNNQVTTINISSKEEIASIDIESNIQNINHFQSPFNNENHFEQEMETPIVNAFYQNIGIDSQEPLQNSISENGGVKLLPDKNYYTMNSDARSIISESPSLHSDIFMSSVSIDLLSQSPNVNNLDRLQESPDNSNQLETSDDNALSSCISSIHANGKDLQENYISHPKIGLYQKLLLSFRPYSMDSVHTHEIEQYKVVSNARLFTGRNFFLCNYRAVIGPDWQSLIITWVLLLVPGLTYFLYLTPVISIIIGWYYLPVLIPELIFFIGAFITLILTSSMDPGIIPKQLEPIKILQKKYKHQKLKYLYQQDDDRSSNPETKMEVINGVTVKVKWCRTCKIYRPPRVSHCRICNNCVRRFDHHCPWMSTCIGERNYRFFYLFLTFALLGIIYGIMTCFGVIIGVVLTKWLKEQNEIGEIALFSGVICALPLVLSGLFCLMLFSILSLWSFHTYLILINKTTNEYITKKYKSKNPFNRGIIRNIVSILFSKIRKSELQMRKTVVIDQEDASLG